MTPAELRAFRERHGLSRRDLAEALGLPNPEAGGQVTVGRWESGAQRPPPYFWRALEHLATELAVAD